MSEPTLPSQENLSTDEQAVCNLYRQFLDSWNRRNAEDFAAFVAKDGELIGFDGSQQFGRAEVASTIAEIFNHHQTPPYLSKIKAVRLISPDVALLRAIVGMIPPGKSEIEPNLNSIQTLVAIRQDGRWQIAQFQNTPAQFHGRPELVQQMTDELRELLN